MIQAALYCRYVEHMILGLKHAYGKALAGTLRPVQAGVPTEYWE